MQLTHGTIIAVADGTKLNLYRNGGTDGAPQLTAIASPDVGTETTDAGSRHQNSSANPSGSQSEEDGFAAATAALLNKMALAGEIDTLVVIAPPRTLGELRLHWHKGLTAKLAGEIAKEMTNASVADITALLAKQ